jgi:hypothetical protein
VNKFRVLVSGVALGVIAITTSSAAAFPVAICVPKAAATAIVTPNTKGECSTEYTKQYAMGGAEKEVFQYLNWTPKGTDGKPEIGFSQANFRLNSQGVTGTGNLIVGVTPIGTTFEGSNGIVVGNDNETEKTEAAVIFGKDNFGSSWSSILGGYDNKTYSEFDTITGGNNNATIGEGGVVTGGSSNSTSSAGTWSVISGGKGNQAEKSYSWIGGGKQNAAEANYSSIFGGLGNKTTKEYEAIP